MRNSAARWLLIVSTLILTLGSLPTWVGRAAQTEEVRFRGIYFDEQDYAVHIAMMQAGRNGDWAYQMRFTSEPHRPAFLRMFYVILGHISGWTGLAPESTYHLARWILGCLALFAIYGLCQRTLPNQTHARFAFLLAAVGSGLGWLQLMLGAPLQPISPIDFWLIDVYVFFSLSIFPHFAFTLALMAAALSLYLDYLRSLSWMKIFWIGLMAVAAQIVNPIAFAVVDAAFVGATLFHWWAKRRIEKKHAAALGALALAQMPLLAYNFIILGLDPLWSQFTTQNQTLSPPLSFYFWGLALFWPFAIAGAIYAYRSRSPAWGALLAWVMSGFILAYLPVYIQRRFLLGITIPLSLLAILGLNEILKWLSLRWAGTLRRENAIYFAYIMLAAVSSIYMSLGSSLYVQARPAEHFYPADLEAALAWLDQNAPEDDFVLGSVDTGQLAAQRTDLKAYIGHPIETLHFENKLAIVEAFYRGSAPADWLAQTPVHWVIYGPFEEELSADFQPTEALQLSYENESVRIYEVESP